MANAHHRPGEIRGDRCGQGEADSDPAHGQALFPGEPVGNHVQAGDVGKAHAANAGNRQADEIDDRAGSAAPDEASYGCDGQGRGPGEANVDFLGDHAPHDGAGHGDPGGDGGKRIQKIRAPSVYPREHVDGDIQRVIDQRAVQQDAQECNEDDKPALSAKIAFGHADILFQFFLTHNNCLDSFHISFFTFLFSHFMFHFAGGLRECEGKGAGAGRA